MKNKKCNVCPHKCNVDRTIQTGRCRVSTLKIARCALHKFEEPCISGENGSGTIFFCGCNLSCVFCQNECVSRNQVGKEFTSYELSEKFKILEGMGANNINLVTPTHFTLEIIKALDIYKPKIPIVYNTSAYETLENIQRLSGYVDIYLPDLKYFSSLLSKRYSNVTDYFEVASKSILEMQKQVKNLFKDGIMQNGLLIRHLILPMCSSDSKNVIKWIAENLSKDCFISVMSQFTPYGSNIEKFKELNRKITQDEYDRVLDYCSSLGMQNVFIQELTSSSTVFIPPFYEEV